MFFPTTNKGPFTIARSVQECFSRQSAAISAFFSDTVARVVCKTIGNRFACTSLPFSPEELKELWEQQQKVAGYATADGTARFERAF